MANLVTWQKIVRVVFAQDITGASRRITLGAIGGDTSPSQSTKMTIKVNNNKISNKINITIEILAIRVKSSNNHLTRA